MTLPELCIRRPVMTTLLMATFVVIGLFAFSFDALMRHLEKVLVPWKGKV